MTASAARSATRGSTWDWLGRIEDRSPDAEADEHAEAVARGEEAARPYGEVFHRLRGRASSERHGMSVDVDGRGRPLAARIDHRPSLGPLLVETGQRALAEARRRALIARAVAADERAAAIPVAAELPKGRLRGVDEEDQWGEVVEFTELAIVGDPHARRRLEEIFAEPALAHLFGGEDADDCRVWARPGLGLRARFPHYGNDGVALGWRAMVLWRRAQAGILADHAERHDGARASGVRDHYGRKHPETPGHEIPAVASALADVRRFVPPPPLADPEVEHLLGREDRDAFVKTVRFEVV